jgi:hypothetical protein
MNGMNANEMVDELMDYFAGKYSPALMRELNRVASNIPEEDRRRVAEQIREDNAPNFKVGVKAMADACKKLGVPYHASTAYAVHAIEWTCDCCGLVFKYAQVVTYEDKHDRGLFDHCPRCGFQVCDTIQARHEAERSGGKVREWYEVRLASFTQCWRNRGAWMFDRKLDDAFEAKRRREEIDAMKAEASRAIRAAADARKAV